MASRKVLGKVLAGRSDRSISFSDLTSLLTALGFDERVKGDHHVFTKDGVSEILNLHPKGGKAKPYQVRQVRNVVVKYGLGLGDGDAE